MGACFILALIPLSMVCTVSPHVAQAQSVASCCLRVSCVSLLARMVSNGLVRFAFNVLVELAAASFASPLFSARVNFLPSACLFRGAIVRSACPDSGRPPHFSQILQDWPSAAGREQGVFCWFFPRVISMFRFRRADIVDTFQFRCIAGAPSQVHRRTYDIVRILEASPR